jgi:hypothetical protein
MVTDEFGANSIWTYPNPISFITPAHHYPNPNFTNLPKRPNVDESVQFTNTSTCYDDNPTGSPCTKPNDSFYWTFSTGTPATSTDEDPKTVYTTLGNKLVGLEVTDSDGYSCEYSDYHGTDKTIRTNFPPPIWKEVLPVRW